MDKQLRGRMEPKIFPTISVLRGALIGLLNFPRRHLVVLQRRGRRRADPARRSAHDARDDSAEAGAHSALSYPRAGIHSVWTVRLCDCL